jgi:hypothetical protein
MYIQRAQINQSKEVSDLFSRILVLNHNSIDPVKFLGFSWISYNLNEGEKTSTYIFREEKQELLVVKEGLVKKGSWEILSLSNSLLINDGEQEILFNISFFGNVGLILKKENVDEFLFLIKRGRANLQEKPMNFILSSFMQDYVKIQQQFNNISLDATDASLEFEDISEFREYKLFPYVATLGSIFLIIIVIIILLSNFWTTT